MRVLLGENIPRALKRSLSGDITAETVQERGWAGTRNGDLLRMAQVDFDAILTSDRGFAHQQNLAAVDLAVVLVRAPGNRISDLLPLLPQIEAALRTATPGTLTTVAASGSA